LTTGVLPSAPRKESVNSGHPDGGADLMSEGERRRWRRESKGWLVLTFWVWEIVCLLLSEKVLCLRTGLVPSYNAGMRRTAAGNLQD
jgi:hypothetical protein